MISPTILAVVIAIFAGLSFTGGFVVSDWRSAARIQKLSSEITVLTAANGKCATDIKNAETAMTVITEAAKERERQATKSMEQAQPQVEQRMAVIRRIKVLPTVAPDQQCEAIKQEQIVYVNGRRGE